MLKLKKNRRVKTNNKNVWFYFAIFTIIILVLLSGGFTYMRSTLHPTTSRFTDLFFDFRHDMSSRIESFFDSTELKSNNQSLKEEVALLNSKLSNYDSIIEENNLFRDQLSILDTQGKNMLLATVINDSSNIYSDRYILNLGSKQGVKIDNLVIYKNNLVGRIVEIEETFSELELISDINAVYPVTIVGESSYKGVLRGILGQDKLKVTNVEKKSVIPIDSYVMLSKDDYVFDFFDDLLIGKVSNIINNDHDVYIELEVTPMLDLSSLDKVFVLL